MNQLQKALKANTIFSSTSGILLIVLNNQIANLFGTVNNTIFWIVGIALIYFALTIGYEIKKQRKPAVIWIIIQDFTWVLGSLILLIFNPYATTQTGLSLIGAVALIVLYMGINQMRALKKSTI
jgi:hypothetical protein